MNVRLFGLSVDDSGALKAIRRVTDAGVQMAKEGARSARAYSDAVGASLGRVAREHVPEAVRAIERLRSVERAQATRRAGAGAGAAGLPGATRGEVDTAGMAKAADAARDVSRALAGAQGEAAKLDGAMRGAGAGSIYAARGMAQAHAEALKMDSALAKGTTAAGSLERGMRLLTGAFGAYQAINLARTTVAMADSYTNLTARLALVTTGTENLAAVQARLFAMAQQTRSPLEATSELYTRLARNGAALGASQGDLLSVTETISKAMIVSGASAQSAQAALVQLGQAFSSGTLRGEELNSVLEQAPRLADAVAAGMGVTVGQLKALGAAGKLTSKEVFDAIKSQREAVGAEFARMPTTVAGAMTQVRNEMLKTVGEMDNANGASMGLVQAITSIAESIAPTASLVNGFFTQFTLGAMEAGIWMEKLKIKAGEMQETVALGLRNLGMTRAADYLLNDSVRKTQDSRDVVGAAEAERNAFVNRGLPKDASGALNGAGDPAVAKAAADKAKALLDAFEKEKAAAEAAKTANVEAAKTIANLRAENAARREMMVAARQGQDAIDQLTIAQAGENAVRQAGTGLTAAHALALRSAAEDAARLTIEERKHGEAVAAQIRIMDARVAAYEKEKAAAKARSDSIVADERAIRDAIAESVAAAAKLNADMKRENEDYVADMHREWIRGMGRIMADGLKSWGNFFEEVFRLSSRLMARMEEAKDTNGLAFKALGAASIGLSAGMAGYQVGAAGNGSRVQGALGGGLAGAGQGAMMGAAIGPIGAGLGAVIGGLAGLAGGILGAGSAAKEAEKNMRGLRESLALSIQGIRAAMSGDELGVAIAQAKAQFDALRKQTEEAYKTGKNEAARKVVLAELNQLESQRIAQLRAEAALIKQQMAEDIRVQILRNTGQAEAADALAAQLEQERRLAALRKQGVDDALIAELKQSEATRDATNAARAKADAEAAAAAQAIEEAAKAAQVAADAAKKAFDQARAVQDLDVELLRAKGQGSAADELEFSLAQKRRMEDAQGTQSEEYIAKLRELQQLQRDSRAAQQLIDSTVPGGAGSASAGATSALAAVSATVTDRTALALVDQSRAQVSLLTRIEFNTRSGGGGGGGVTIHNRFDFSAKLTEAELRDVVERITDGIDEALGAKSSRAGLYSGSVGR